MLQIDRVGVDAEQPGVQNDLDAQPVEIADPAVADVLLDGLARVIPLTTRRTRQPSRASFSATPRPIQSQRQSATTIEAPTLASSPGQLPGIDHVTLAGALDGGAARPVLEAMGSLNALSLAGAFPTPGDGDVD